MACFSTEKEIIAAASLLAGAQTDLSESESELARRNRVAIPPSKMNQIRASILAGDDPLGDAFITIRSPLKRRAKGAIYTPPSIVESMISWAKGSTDVDRVVDPGAGSGRFLLAAGRHFPNAHLVGIEIDPVAALILRANLAACKLAKRATVCVADYRSLSLPKISGPTLFIGNPPYVRHHAISEKWKSWYSGTASEFGIKASKLAGLHLHFFLKTLKSAKPGDFGAFITAAEWLDVNYGLALRQWLANGLGGSALHVIDPKAAPFPGTATTGAITCFRVGQRPKFLRVNIVRSAEDLGCLKAGRQIPWGEMAASNRWSFIIHAKPRPPIGYVELGEICRVHRGQVTGANKIWIANGQAECLPAELLMPTVTRAKEIIDANGILADAGRLRKVVDLPVDLERLDSAVRPAVDRFLRWAKANGAADSYIARYRRAWWSVGLPEPAPILCTYMARRPPVFARNICDARHLNISHGLYPRDVLSSELLEAILKYLQANITTDFGRTYAGGLTKFEPRELERVPIPRLENLVV